ncbi:MAG: bifunctional pyr operon transcriptional regulator/uracil phosphoribosyltransferase PyrR [Erysipelotrichaceae bacterium]
MKLIMDESAIKRTMVRIAHEIVERNKGVKDIVLVGIKTRGVHLAKVLQDNILSFEGVVVPMVSIDVRGFRDDIDTGNIVKEKLSVDIVNKKVILVDDVLYKGRTVRAAIDGVLSNGRPKEIQLAVLIDRGHRELPIRADFVGKNLPTSTSEKVLVRVVELDGETSVGIVEEKRVG